MVSLCLQGVIKRLNPYRDVSCPGCERCCFDILHGYYVGRETDKAVAWKLGMADLPLFYRRRQAIEVITQMLADPNR